MSYSSPVTSDVEVDPALGVDLVIDPPTEFQENRNIGVRCGVLEEAENLDDTRDLLHVMLQWMAADRAEKRVDREERRKRFDQISTRLDRLESLMTEQQRWAITNWQQQLEEQAEVRRGLDGLKKELEHLSEEIQVKHTTTHSPTFGRLSTEPAGNHTQRIRTLRDQLVASPADQPPNGDDLGKQTHQQVYSSTTIKQVPPRLPDLPQIPANRSFERTFPIIETSPNSFSGHRSPGLQLMQFDGETSWESYCVHLETVSEANGWDDDICRSHVAANLRGRALEFFQTLDREVQRDLSRLIRALERRFGSKQNMGVIQNKFRNRHQKTNESLEEFAADIQRLGRTAHPSWPSGVISELCLSQFLDGIGDLDLQCVVRDREPKNIDDALDIAERLELNRKTARTTRKLTVRTAEMHPPLETPQVLPTRVPLPGNENEST